MLSLIYWIIIASNHIIVGSYSEPTALLHHSQLESSSLPNVAGFAECFFRALGKEALCRVPKNSTRQKNTRLPNAKKNTWQRRLFAECQKNTWQRASLPSIFFSLGKDIF